MQPLKKQGYIEITGETAMQAFGHQLAQACNGHGIIYLHGSLGAGKTTLCRGILRGLGYTDKVKSPTFTIVEPYLSADGKMVYHFDLYRLGDPEELDLIGARDYFHDNTLCLIEWPERGYGWLPDADIDVYIEYAIDKRIIRFCVSSSHGKMIFDAVQTKSYGLSG